MENPIQRQIDSIVIQEIVLLTKVLDDWFKEHEDRCRIQFPIVDPYNMPVLHLADDVDSDGYLNYIVMRISRYQDDYSLTLHRFTAAYEDDLDDDDTITIRLLNGRKKFVPGELTKLARFVKLWISPQHSLYETSGQRQLIKDFIRAYDNLEKGGVGMLYDMEQEKAYFYNAADVDAIDFNTGENEIELSQLPSMDFCTYKFNTDDTLSATMKSNIKTNK